MARHFDGAGDNLRNLDGFGGIDVDAFTIAFGFVPAEIGGGSSQNMLQTAAAFGSGQLRSGIFTSSADVLSFVTNFSSTNGSWTWDTTVVQDQVYRMVVTYDRSSVANNPEFFIDGVKYTVGGGITESATPVGTAASSTDSLTLGETVVAGQDFEGDLFDVAFWSTTLGDNACLAISSGFSPSFYRTNGQFYYPLISSSLVDKWGRVALTATNTTVVAHPRTIYPGHAISIPAAAVVAGGLTPRSYPRGANRGIMRGAA